MATGKGLDGNPHAAPSRRGVVARRPDEGNVASPAAPERGPRLCGKRTFTMVCKRLDLDKSELLYKFDAFDPKDWSIVKGTPEWHVARRKIRGGRADEPTHGQIFFKRPVKGDVVLEFDAKIVRPSYHDLVWFWNTDFNGDPWGEGYLGCLGGWWDDMAGIEKLPDYLVSAIAPSFRTEPGRKYHVVSGSMGASHFIVVDGKLVTYFADKNVPDPRRPGHFGFGVYESCAEYSNLKVYRPHWTDIGERKYAPGTSSLYDFPPSVACRTPDGRRDDLL